MTTEPKFRRRYNDNQLYHLEGVEKDIELKRCYEIINAAVEMAEYYLRTHDNVIRREYARDFMERVK